MLDGVLVREKRIIGETCGFGVVDHCAAYFGAGGGVGLQLQLALLALLALHPKDM